MLKQLRYFQSVVKNNSFSEDSWRCIPNAVESGIIYGTGAWDKGDIYKNPALAQACEMGKQI